MENVVRLYATTKTVISVSLSKVVFCSELVGSDDATKIG